MSMPIHFPEQKIFIIYNIHYKIPNSGKRQLLQCYYGLPGAVLLTSLKNSSNYSFERIYVL